LGDMGCHLFDPVMKSLEFTTPLRVRAECDPPRDETWPRARKVHFDFPETKYTAGPITMTWYDGGFGRGHHPSLELVPLAEGEKLPGEGSIFAGERGVVLVPHWSTPRLLPAKYFADHEIEIVPDVNRWHSFVNACRGEGKTSANIEYSGP